MRENEPVMLVLSVCDGEILLEKGEMLSEKRHYKPDLTKSFLVSARLSPVQCKSFNTKTKSALEAEAKPVVSPLRSC